MERDTLCKAERLCSKLQIEKLFSGGSRSFSVYPLRVVFMPVKREEGALASILISVSKRRFKRAVKRNRVKRQVREAYRKNKHELLGFLNERTEGMAIAFIYLADGLVPTGEIERKMKIILARIMEKPV
ncbi:MAG: ribonuclease P protein component [Mediterranea sp.]|jgi:ribonuclease P protein component|nr:ribonuclease P protein component [Mediterranea sp.]